MKSLLTADRERKPGEVAGRMFKTKLGAVVIGATYPTRKKVMADP